MGFLMLAGLIGSVVYGSHCIKNDIRAEIADSKCKPTLSVDSNQKNIRTNFTVICKRAGIRLSDRGLPLDEMQCHKGMEYLQYQGYDPESVEYFKKLFHYRYLRQVSNTKSSLKSKHSQLLKFLNASGQKEVLITYRRDYYGSQDPVSRMEKIAENPLWGRIVDNYTYIRSGSAARYTEVWNFKVPMDFFKSKENMYQGKTKPEELYDEVCWLQELDNGSFI